MTRISRRWCCRRHSSGSGTSAGLVCRLELWQTLIDADGVGHATCSGGVWEWRSVVAHPLGDVQALRFLLLQLGLVRPAAASREQALASVVGGLRRDGSDPECAVRSPWASRRCGRGQGSPAACGSASGAGGRKRVQARDEPAVRPAPPLQGADSSCRLSRFGRGSCTDW
jgi:hypothetical protein